MGRNGAVRRLPKVCSRARAVAAPVAARAASVSRNDEATIAMAKNPQKVKDATEEALTAIQEALNVRDAGTPPPSSPPSPPVEQRIEPRPEPRPEPRVEQRAEPRPEPRQEPRVEPVTIAAAPPDLFHQEPESSGWADEELPPRRTAANDDRATVGQLLQNLQQRPSRTPYAIASLVALAWTAGILSFAYLFRSDLLQLIGASAFGP